MPCRSGSPQGVVRLAVVGAGAATCAAVGGMDTEMTTPAAAAMAPVSIANLSRMMASSALIWLAATVSHEAGTLAHGSVFRCAPIARPRAAIYCRARLCEAVRD